MIDRSGHHGMQDFLVRVGHLRLAVRCPNSQDAILAARQRLSDELPRMWDLIHQLDDRRFRVDLIRDATAPTSEQ